MMRLPLATRLGLLLFAVFSALGLFLLALLYTLFSHSLAAQAAEELLHRGHGHADALGRQWGPDALAHVA